MSGFGSRRSVRFLGSSKPGDRDAARGTARQRCRRDGYPCRASRRADQCDRPTLARRSPRNGGFRAAAGFRRLAQELEVSPAVLARRYGLSLDIDTLVLGVTNRRERRGGGGGSAPCGAGRPHRSECRSARGEIATSFKFGNRPQFGDSPAADSSPGEIRRRAALPNRGLSLPARHLHVIRRDFREGNALMRLARKTVPVLYGDPV